MKMLKRLRAEAPTWLSHSIIASLVTIALDPMVGPWVAYQLAIWGYAWREGDQLWNKWRVAWAGYLGGKGLLRKLRWTFSVWHTSVNWIGSAGDVAAPALVAWLVVGWWLL